VRIRKIRLIRVLFRHGLNGYQNRTKSTPAIWSAARISASRMRTTSLRVMPDLWSTYTSPWPLPR